MSSSGCNHTQELLPAFVNGTLSKDEERRVREHLTECDVCRAELASWEAVAGATVAASGKAPAPSAQAWEGVWARIQREEAAAGSPSPVSLVSLVWQLLKGQAPLVRNEIWVASAITMALGCVVALLAATPSATGLALSMFAPLIAAVGVAFIYGPENDPSLELALSTPTSPRMVLLSRLTLVHGYDLALAAAASVLLVAVKGVSLWPLISLWLGPMLFLSALALLLSLLLGTTAASLTAMGLWGVRLLAEANVGSGLGVWEGAALVEALWASTPLLVALAAVMLAATLIFVPRMERLA